jgi:hypothetical protein
MHMIITCVMDELSVLEGSCFFNFGAFHCFYFSLVLR